MAGCGGRLPRFSDVSAGYAVDGWSASGDSQAHLAAAVDDRVGGGLRAGPGDPDAAYHRSEPDEVRGVGLLAIASLRGTHYFFATTSAGSGP